MLRQEARNIQAKKDNDKLCSPLTGKPYASKTPSVFDHEGSTKSLIDSILSDHEKPPASASSQTNHVVDIILELMSGLAYMAQGSAQENEEVGLLAEEERKWMEQDDSNAQKGAYGRVYTDGLLAAMPEADRLRVKNARPKYVMRPSCTWVWHPACVAVLTWTRHVLGSPALHDACAAVCTISSSIVVSCLHAGTSSR